MAYPGKIALLDMLISPSWVSTVTHLPPYKPKLHPSTRRFTLPLSGRAQTVSVLSSCTLSILVTPQRELQRFHPPPSFGPPASLFLSATVSAPENIAGLINHCYSFPGLFADTPLSRLTLLPTRSNPLANASSPLFHALRLKGWHPRRAVAQTFQAMPPPELARDWPLGKTTDSVNNRYMCLE